ncbi:hypothetical protein BGX38DRAFT_1278937 [Terfezia claveryi]|nr:hypothetical protein BGX38DRAFT_1278937 [Terfezia claveryi]
MHPRRGVERQRRRPDAAVRLPPRGRTPESRVGERPPGDNSRRAVSWRQQRESCLPETVTKKGCLWETGAGERSPRGSRRLSVSRRQTTRERSRGVTQPEERNQETRHPEDLVPKWQFVSGGVCGV